MLISIQAKQNATKECGGVILSLEVAVELEELWKKGKDKGEGYLGPVSKVSLQGKHGHTRSSNKETKMTRKIRLRLAGDTGVADMIGGKW